jgi:hypothetical protein
VIPDPTLDDCSRWRVCDSCGADYVPAIGHVCGRWSRRRARRPAFWSRCRSFGSLVLLFAVLTVAALLLVAFVRELTAMFGGAS